nr:alpha/beta hydrolases superfamily protein [Tanacetum cinerariifolium]
MCFRCGDPNHLIGECPKPSKDKNQRAFVGGSWSDSGEEDDEKVKDEMCHVAQASSEPLIIQQDHNLKLKSNELMMEQRNELSKAMQSMFEEYRQREQAANLRSQDSLIMGNEDLSTIPKKESDEVIKSSVKDLVLIPSESEDTSGSHSECILSSCDDFSPINIFEEKSMTFPNPLFNSNDDFTSSDDESLSDEDILKDNAKIYSNPLFEFDDEYISSDDEYFDPRGDFEDIDAFLDINTSTDVKDGYHDSEGDIIYLESLLTNETIPSLLSKDCVDFDDSRAHGFVLRSIEL